MNVELVLQAVFATGLAAAAVLYGTGVRRLWRRAGRGHGVSGWRVGAGAAAVLILIVALLSPLDALADDLFSAHMVQHLLLLLIAPPLLVAAAPEYVGLWGLSVPARQRLTRWWRHSPRARSAVSRALRPGPVWAANVAILWFWHLPTAYDAAVRHQVVHALEHASFLIAAFFFWWLLFRHGARRRQMDRGVGLVYVFTAGLQCSALGALLALAGSPWYAVHAHTTAAWGLTPLEDQQIAGLIMWIPAGLVYLLVAAVLFVQWIEQPTRRGAMRPGVGRMISSRSSSAYPR